MVHTFSTWHTCVLPGKMMLLVKWYGRARQVLTKTPEHSPYGLLNGSLMISVSLSLSLLIYVDLSH